MRCTGTGCAATPATPRTNAPMNWRGKACGPSCKHGGRLAASLIPEHLNDRRDQDHDELHRQEEDDHRHGELHWGYCLDAGDAGALAEVFECPPAVLQIRELGGLERELLSQLQRPTTNLASELEGIGKGALDRGLAALHCC